MHHTFAREHARPTDAPARNAACLRSNRVATWSGKPASTQRAIAPGAIASSSIGETFGSGRSDEKLLGELLRFARARRRQFRGDAAATRIEVGSFPQSETRAEQNERSDSSSLPKKSSRCVAHLLAFGAAEQIAALGERGNECDPAHAALCFGREQHSRITRMNRKGEHAFA